MLRLTPLTRLDLIDIIRANVHNLEESKHPEALEFCNSLTAAGKYGDATEDEIERADELT